MRHLPLRVLLILAVTVTACRSATEPRTDLLEAHAFPSRLVLENRTDEPVYYFALIPDPGVEVEYSLCTVPPVTCASVPARGSVSIPYSRIYGYDFGDREATVAHWRLVPVAAAGRLEATDLRGLSVRLY